MKIKLDERLSAVVSFVLSGKPIADIGTDHAYLPVYIAINDICPYVIAIDKRQMPYNKASKLVDLLALQNRIFVRMGDGLNALYPGEVSTVTIAGLGGQLIINILMQDTKEVLSKVERLVLQPQKNVDTLRQWLSENSWCITGEKMAYDDGFYYPVICAEPGKMQLNNVQKIYGPCLLKNPTPRFRDYLRQKLTNLDALIQQLEQKEGAEAIGRLKELYHDREEKKSILNSIAKKK